MLKSAVITIDFHDEKIVGIDFFNGTNCWCKASAFAESMRDDFKLPRYHAICSATKEAKREGLENMGIIMPEEEMA